jgi:alkylated DNA repair dioxygenase AlkB
MKLDLFEFTENQLPHHGEVYFYTNFFSKEESDLFYSELKDEVPWKQEPIKIFGKEVMQPRLTAWYGDEGKSYTYSGITMSALSWSNTLLKIKDKVENFSGLKFNSALLNNYRNGNDSMGWHRDNEKELGVNPAIASVSLGTSRVFKLRNYLNKKELVSFELIHGSLLTMLGETNHYWEHAIPKTTKVNSGRINITFRFVY